MQKLKRLALFYLALFCFLIPKAQEIERCNTTLDYSYVQANDPSMYQHFLDNDNCIAQYISSGGSNGRLINANGTIIIPVVIHVLHQGEPIGTGLNVSDAIIQSQIDVLNEDFRRLNADRVNTPSDFAGRAADFNIEFRLACIDPNGNATTGIERKQTSRNFFSPPTSVRPDGSPIEGTGSAKMLPDGLPAWPSNKYLNIWVCNLASDAGYSSMPEYLAAHPEEDGVVITASAFGRTGSGALGGGRTATHEIAHWLDILHLNYDNRFTCTDDFVSDTPKEMTIDKTCRTYPFLSNRCDASDPSTMFMNFMEWVPDNCMNLFTAGQKQRARAMFARIGSLAGPRAGMLDNVFGFTGQPTSINCKGKITVSPMCLPVTWTVTGPATITSGAGTNQIELTVSSAGTVHLVATSGNYTAETDISVTRYIPAQPGPISFPLIDYSLGKIQASIDPVPYATSYNWYKNGQLITVPDGHSTFIQFPISKTQCDIEYDIAVEAVDACGVSLRSHGNAAVPCDGYFMLSPNPSQNEVTVSTNQSLATTSKTFSEIYIYDMTGNMKKVVKFNKVTSATINISGLTNGTYIVEIKEGGFVERKQLSVQK